MRTVLFIGPLPEPTTGQSLACQVLLDALVRGGHQVHVVNLSKAEFKQGVSSFRRVLQVLRIVWEVWRHRKAADVIYLTVAESISGNLKDLLIYLVCYGQLPKMVIHLHGGAGMRIIMQRHGWLQRANAALVSRLGGAVVLGSRHVPIFAGAIAAHRVHVVPNFAVDDLFAASEEIDSKFSQTTPLRLLFLSNLLPGKGHQELLSALLALPPQLQASVEVDFAGGFESTSQRDEFLAAAAQLPFVRYHGLVKGEQKRALFFRAHVFCLPTYYPYEGQPISILEAYAAGCAVITTDHSGIFDIFTDGENGFAVIKQSVDSLRLAIEKAVAAPEVMRRMAITNANTARALYRVPMHTQKLIEILSRVAGNRP